MGMYDRFYTFDARVPLPCAAGHPQLRNQFQTKDFDEPGLDGYYLYEGRLFRVAGRSKDTGDEKLLPDGEAVVLVTSRRAEFFPFTGVLNVYTYCYECAPVLFESGSAREIWGDIVQERKPRIVYSLTFRNGRLEAVKPVELQSREDVRRELREALGERVLPDDDRLARRHFELLNKKGLRERGE